MDSNETIMKEMVDLLKDQHQRIKDLEATNTATDKNDTGLVDTDVSPLMKEYLKSNSGKEYEDKKPMSADEYTGKGTEGVSPMMEAFLKK